MGTAIIFGQRADSSYCPTKDMYKLLTSHALNDKGIRNKPWYKKYPYQCCVLEKHIKTNGHEYN